MSLVGPELQTHEVAMHTHLSPDVPAVLGDHIQVQQVLLNLMMNAIEAMIITKEGPRELWVVAEKHDAQYVVVEVKNCGPDRAAAAGPPVRSVLFHEAWRARHGPRDLSFDCRSARRTAVGYRERGSRGRLSLYIADQGGEGGMTETAGVVLASTTMRRCGSRSRTSRGLSDSGSRPLPRPKSSCKRNGRMNQAAWCSTYECRA